MWTQVGRGFDEKLRGVFRCLLVSLRSRKVSGELRVAWLRRAEEGSGGLCGERERELTGHVAQGWGLSGHCEGPAKVRSSEC